MKKIILLITALFATGAFFISSCGSNKNDNQTSEDKPVDVQELTKNQPEEHGTEIRTGDIKLEHPLNAQWVASGKSIYEMKCQGCHKLTVEKLVGPGWKGVTSRRSPVWIMNMITNVDMMLEKDPEAQKLLEQCLVRMPNQNLTKEEARTVLEFQRSNDGEK
jgi:hypothetical protein